MAINQQQNTFSYQLNAMLCGKTEPQKFFDQIYQPYRDKSKEYYRDLLWLVLYGFILLSLLAFTIALTIFLIHYQTTNFIIGKAHTNVQYQHKNWSSRYWIWLLLIFGDFIAFCYCQFYKIGLIMRHWQYQKHRWFKKWLNNQELFLVTTFWLSLTKVKFNFYTGLKLLIKQNNSFALHRLNQEQRTWLENLINLAHQVRVQ